MKTVVLSDIHSRQQKLTNLLVKIGAMDDEAKRVDGFHIIQLGDAVSLGYGMKEAYFLNWLEPWVDEWLIGNHEAPALWSYDDRLKFYGYCAGDLGTDGADPEAVRMVRAQAHRYKLATNVGDWLITHAGLHETNQGKLFSDPGDYFAEDFARELNARWDSHMRNDDPHSLWGCPVCSQSGVLWWRMERSDRYNGIKQIFGHTPNGPWTHKSGLIHMIDTPRVHPVSITGRKDAEGYGGVVAMVTEDDGETWEQFYEQ